MLAVISKGISKYRKTGLRGLIRALEIRVRRAIFSPRISVDFSSSTVRLGTEYGGWRFVDRPELYNSIIISAGLGEDASFDVEFAARYNARVVVVDPTPRAIEHFGQIAKRFGLQSTRNYSSSGALAAEAYDLSSLNKKNFIYIEKALWIESEKVRFFKPPNKEHVSHSIINYQHNYSEETEYIEVEGITIDVIMGQIGIKCIDLLKLDIEGAEVPVIDYMIGKGIKPKQLLVEFDELNIPSIRARKNFEKTDRKLKDAGYKLLYFDGKADFLYLLC